VLLKTHEAAKRDIIPQTAFCVQTSISKVYYGLQIHE